MINQAQQPQSQEDNQAQKQEQQHQPPPDKNKNPKPRAKVFLQPGFSPLDWARTQKTQQPTQPLTGYTMDEVRSHKTKEDCWVVLKGKVYNVSSYLPYHPGGQQILLSLGGKEITQIFMRQHSWVNEERILEKCLLGFLKQ